MYAKTSQQSKRPAAYFFTLAQSLSKNGIVLARGKTTGDKFYGIEGWKTTA